MSQTSTSKRLPVGLALAALAIAAVIIAALVQSSPDDGTGDGDPQQIENQVTYPPAPVVVDSEVEGPDGSSDDPTPEADASNEAESLDDVADQVENGGSAVALDRQP